MRQKESVWNWSGNICSQKANKASIGELKVEKSFALGYSGPPWSLFLFLWQFMQAVFFSTMFSLFEAGVKLTFFFEFLFFKEFNGILLLLVSWSTPLQLFSWKETFEKDCLASERTEFYPNSVLTGRKGLPVSHCYQFFGFMLSMNVRGQMKILITKLQSSLFTRTKKRMASMKKESLHGMAVKVFLSMRWECSMRHKMRFVLLFRQQCQLFLKDHIVSLLNKTKAFCSTIVGFFWTTTRSQTA